jgi:hypothetical protein
VPAAIGTDAKRMAIALAAVDWVGVSSRVLDIPQRRAFLRERVAQLVRMEVGEASLPPWSVCHNLCYSPRVASRTVRARLDPQSEADLTLLLREGGTESEAVRLALAEAAKRRRRRSTLRAEVARLAADADDRRAREEALGDLDGVQAPWPS